MGFRMTNVRGMTLVELMIALVLSALLMMAVYLIYGLQHKSSNDQYQSVAVQQDIRAVGDMIEGDIRAAGRSFTIPAATDGILQGSGPSVLYTCSVDEAGKPAQKVKYEYDGDALILKRNDLDLLNNCTSFGLKYFNSTGAVITPSGSDKNLAAEQCKLVRRIRVSIAARSNKVDTDTGKYLVRNFERTVRCRNMEINRKTEE